MHHPTDRIAHTTTFVRPVVEHWLEREDSSMGHIAVDARQQTEWKEGRKEGRKKMFYLMTHSIGNWETVLTCLHPIKVQTRLPRDQRPTKPVSRLVAGSALNTFYLRLYGVRHMVKDN